MLGATLFEHPRTLKATTGVMHDQTTKGGGSVVTAGEAVQGMQEVLTLGSPDRLGPQGLGSVTAV